MYRTARTFTAFAAGALLTMAGALVAPPATAAPGEPDPVLGAPVFNNPAGTVAAQYAIFQQLARVIDRVPAGGDIEMSWFEFGTPADATDTATQPNIAARLVAAHQRGVDVRIILDNNPKKEVTDPTKDGSNDDQTPYQTLAPVLGTSAAASSYILLCGSPAQQRVGCIAKRPIYNTVYAYNHNKFLTASSIVMNDGTVKPNVVFQSSSNLGPWDAHTAYNNAITWSEAGSYADYREYFDDLRDYRTSATGVADYYRVGASANTYKTHFFPRRETNGDLQQASTDTIVNVLNSVTCSYDGGRQTDVRVVMWSFNREAVAHKLAALARNNCWVDIVYTNASDDVKAILAEVESTESEIDVTQCAVAYGGRSLRPHSKYMLIDGAYDDDQIPRVFAGSANFAISSLRNADEAMVRVRDASVHAAYLANFYKVRDTCSGKIAAGNW